MPGMWIDTASLSVQGSDKLVLTGANTTTGELNIAQNSSVQLGDGTGDNAAWSGTIAGAGCLTVSTSGSFAVGDRANGLTGTLTLARGTLDLSGAAAATNILIQSGALANAGSYAGTDTNKVHVNAVADSGNIALGGLDAAGLGSVVTASAGTQLTGLKQGSIWTVNGMDSILCGGAGNISGDPFSGEDFLIQFEGHGDNLGSISFGDGSTLTLDLTSVMDAMKTAGGNLEILLTNGGFAQDLETLKSHMTANPLLLRWASASWASTEAALFSPVIRTWFTCLPWMVRAARTIRSRTSPSISTRPSLWIRTFMSSRTAPW